MLSNCVVHNVHNVTFFFGIKRMGLNDFQSGKRAVHESTCPATPWLHLRHIKTWAHAYSIIQQCGQCGMWCAKWHAKPTPIRFCQDLCEFLSTCTLGLTLNRLNGFWNPLPNHLSPEHEIKMRQKPTFIKRRDTLISSDFSLGQSW